MGYVTIVGRGKDLIISGGYNIYPKEIELFLDAQPGVRESAVVGAPHPDFGESVVAVLVPEAGAEIDLAAIEAAARAELAGFKAAAPCRRAGGIAAQHDGQGAEGRAAQDLRRGLSPEGWVMSAGQGGGETGIRTLGGLAPTTVFETPRSTTPAPLRALVQGQ